MVFSFLITIQEAKSLIDSYYEERLDHMSDDERIEEADKVSSRIAESLSERAFSFSPNEYISIHRKLFQGIYKHAGNIRDYNITKKEWVLDGATVMYGSASELRATFEYDFSQEKILVIKVFRWTRLFIILRCLFQIYGRSIFLRKMHGILEMRLSVQITRICRKVFMKQQNILKYSSEIYF